MAIGLSDRLCQHSNSREIASLRQHVGHLMRDQRVVVQERRPQEQGVRLGLPRPLGQPPSARHAIRREMRDKQLHDVRRDELPWPIVFVELVHAAQLAFRFTRAGVRAAGRAA